MVAREPHTRRKEAEARRLHAAEPSGLERHTWMRINGLDGTRPLHRPTLKTTHGRAVASCKDFFFLSQQAFLVEVMEPT